MTQTGQNSLQRRATAAMEAESRAWMVQCPHCGAERSVWASGGIRYKAAGTSRLYRRCFACGKRGWHKVYWAGGVPGAAPASAGFVVRLVLAIVFGVLAATALILFAAFKLAGII
jgi:hypothetical protein